MWSTDGRELYFRNFDKVMATRLATTPDFHVERPEMLFQGRYDGEFAVARDGRFLMMRTKQDVPVTQFNLVVNWVQELEQRMATK